MRRLFGSRQRQGVFALYEYLDDAIAVITKLRAQGDKFDVFTPTYYHELEAALGYEPSKVRWFTLTGALLGVTFGFGLCLLTDYDWPLVVGGKTAGIYSLPAYVVIGFEMMILLGAIATILGVLLLGKVPNPKGRIYSTQTTDSRFGIYVYGIDDKHATAKLLQERSVELEVFR
ncbi:MAG: DUF3341 domain-containing protein [Pseudomonadota bacterium]|nr:DUF3341 domain-containing protein [Pseudomonadota bacterium]